VAEAAERVGVLVIRARIESDDLPLWVRVSGRLDVAAPVETSVVVQGRESALELVRDWLQQFEAAQTPIR